MFAPLRFIRSLLGAINSTTSQSSGINGDGNNVDQSVNNYYIFDGHSSVARQDAATKQERPLIKRPLSAQKFAQAARVNDTPVTVFLAGPFIRPDVALEPNSSDASKLRYEIFHRLTREGFIVSLGIYPDLLASFQTGTGMYHNSAEAELTHARDVASLVIMIPDSPGSFAEIGAFSLKEEICRKMIILADVARKRNLGYLNTGPVACAEAFGSTVERVDYKDVEACIKAVTKFTHKVKTQIQLQSRLGA